MKSIFFLLFLFAGSVALGQINYLQTKITVAIDKQPLAQALHTISQAGGFYFSYNAELFNPERLVSVQQQQQSVKKSLKQLFPKHVKYKVVGKHVILLKKTQPKKKAPTTPLSPCHIAGYILSARTAKALQNATVYNLSQSTTALSNKQGQYQLTLPNTQKPQLLSFSKRGFLDTVISIQPQKLHTLHVRLRPKIAPISRLAPAATNVKVAENIHNYSLARLFIPKQAQLVSQNTPIFDWRNFKFSIVPFVDTDYWINGLKTNKVSINLLAGYSAGIDGFELGGIVNLSERDVNGLQISGISNITGKNNSGIQLGGILNLTLGKQEGIQVGGIANLVKKHMEGIQLSGVLNANHAGVDGIQLAGINNMVRGKLDGIQLAGISNFVAAGVDGVQISGLLNVSAGQFEGAALGGIANAQHGDMNGILVAGMANLVTGNSDGAVVSGISSIVAGHVKKIQLSGYLNYAESVDGLQAAGYINLCTQKCTGVQLSGLVNYTKELAGTQLSVINYADSVSSGVPIGFLSYVKKGYRGLEVYSNGSYYLGLAFRTGIRRFYNIFSFGARVNWIGAGYGIGTQFRLRHPFSLDIFALRHAVFETGTGFKTKGKHTALHTQINYNLKNLFTIFCGPSINMYKSVDQTAPETPLYPYSFINSNKHGATQYWLGGQVGIRF